VVSMPKKVEISFDLYDYDLDLPPSGQDESFKIDLKSRMGVVKQTYRAKGKITKKNIKSSAGAKTISNYAMSQARLGNESMTINNFIPTQGATGSLIGINGNHLTDTHRVMLGDFECKISGSVSLSRLDVIVPNNIYVNYRAPLYVINKGGERLGTTSTYKVTDGIDTF